MTELPTCYICDGCSGDIIVSPCKCKGSVGYVHKKCLLKWINDSKKTKCQTCGVDFSGLQYRFSKDSITAWIVLTCLLIIFAPSLSMLMAFFAIYTIYDILYKESFEYSF